MARRRLLLPPSDLLPPDPGDFGVLDLGYDPAAGDFGPLAFAYGDADMGIGLDPVPEPAPVDWASLYAQGMQAFDIAGNEARRAQAEERSRSTTMLEPGLLNPPEPAMEEYLRGGEAVQRPLSRAGILPGMGESSPRFALDFEPTPMDPATAANPGAPFVKGEEFLPAMGRLINVAGSAAPPIAAAPFVFTGNAPTVARIGAGIIGGDVIDAGDAAMRATGAAAKAANDALPDSLKLVGGSRAAQAGQVPVNPLSEMGKGDYDAAQRAIDAAEDALEKQGVDLLDLWTGRKPLPPELQALYDARDAIGKNTDDAALAGILGRLPKGMAVGGTDTLPEIVQRLYKEGQFNNLMGAKLEKPELESLLRRTFHAVAPGYMDYDDALRIANGAPNPYGQRPEPYLETVNAVFKAMMGDTPPAGALPAPRLSAAPPPTIPPRVPDVGPVSEPPIPPSVVYHGTPNVFEKWNPGKANGDALYGPGIYFTENPDVASGYARTAARGADAAPNVRPANISVTRPFDADAVPDETLMARVQELGENLLANGEDRANLVFPDDIKTNGDLYRLVTGALGNKSETNDWLTANGYDAITHIGGKNTGTKPHRVWIMLDDETYDAAGSRVMPPVTDRIKAAFGGSATAQPSSAEAAGNITPPFNRTLPTEDEAAANLTAALERADRARTALRTMFPERPPKVEPPDPPEVPSGGGRLPNGSKERGFAETVRTSEQADPGLRADLARNPITYNPITNAGTRAEAEALIAESVGNARALLYATTEPLDALTSTVGQLLIKRAQDAGDLTDAYDLTRRLAERATKAGQGIQALNMFSAMATEEGVGIYAMRFLDEVAEKSGDKSLLAKLTPEKLAEFRLRASGIENMAEGRDKLLLTAMLQRDIHELAPESLLKKLAFVQTAGQLLNPKTFMRNIVGNTMFGGAEQFSKAMATLFDVPVSVVSGQRSVTLPSARAQAGGFLRGLREGMEEAALGVNLSQVGTQFELGSGATRTFRSGPGAAAESAMSYTLRVPDRAFYQMTVDGSLLEQATVTAMNEGLRGAERAARVTELLGNPTKDMQAIAHQEALFRTFQDENWLSTATQGLKKALNLGKEFGVGDMVLKYPRTPANIIMRAIDYGPSGFMSAAIDLARTVSPVGGKPFNQKAFVEKLGRSTVGTAGLTFAGYAMAEAGVLTGRSDKDKDVRALRSSEGAGAYRFNLDAFKRWVGTGFTEKQSNQKGDTFISYDWAPPLSVALAVGAEASAKGQSLAKAKQRPLSLWDKLSGEFLGDVLGGGVDALVATVDVVATQPMLAGVERLFSGNATPGERLVNIAKQVPASFVPTLMSQFNQALNNTTRETYDPDAVQEALNTALAKIPILANALPDRVNAFGEPQDRYWQDTNNPFNVFVNPAFVTQYLPRPEAEMVLELQRATGETAQAPRLVDKTLTHDGVTYQLTAKEYTEYQRALGQKVREAFGNLADSASFRQQDPEQQVERLVSVMTRLNALAKDELRLRASIVDADDHKSYFAALDPLKPPKDREPLSEKNAAAWAEAQPLLKRYEDVKADVLEAMPVLKQRQADADAALAAGNKALAEAYQSQVDRYVTAERRRFRILNPDVDMALVRWQGLDPLTPDAKRWALGVGR